MDYGTVAKKLKVPEAKASAIMARAVAHGKKAAKAKKKTSKSY